MSATPAETTYYRSPAGWIEITAHSGGISKLIFREPEGDILPAAGLLADCTDRLSSYFQGKLKEFGLPLAPAGSEFQLRVWNELLKIPYGRVISYSELAERVGGPTYTRIVGQANGRNPVAILIPCHRVIGSNGALTGYAGGLWRKQFLLELEQKNSKGFNPTLFDSNP